MKARLRLVPGMTTRQAIDEANAEHTALEQEARQHVAHLRLVARQLTFWEPEQVAKALTRLADRYERKWTEDHAA